jgi:hypothetical protein
MPKAPASASAWRNPRCVTLRALLTGVIAIAAGRDGNAQPAQTRPASQPALFQPGVQIDWAARTVIVHSRVVLRRGPLEFFACLSGKEHESILRLEAAGVHIFMALGLVGLTPGHPPIWDENRQSYSRPAGELVEIVCQWEVDGRSQSASPFDFLREIEFARRPIERPWVFCGSIVLADGSLACDQTGAALALVDFPEALLALSRGGSSENSRLWAEANPESIPPVGTTVLLLLRPAQPRPRRVELDFRGQTWLDGKFVSLPDLIDILLLQRQLEPLRTQTISVRGALRSDVVELQCKLAEAGLAVSFTE